MKSFLRGVHTPGALLKLGIATRCIVYLFLSPHNNDAHISIVDYLVKHGTFPNIVDNYLAFHPPLYYLMAAPILAFTGSDKAVQFLSLVTSICTVIVLYQIIYKTSIIVRPRVQLYCLLFSCFLPQFVMFGLYVSNDSLTFLLGGLTVLQASRYLQAPGWKQGALLAVVTGLGLLTKTSFLAFVPVLVLFVLFVEFREHHSFFKAARAMTVFIMISCVLGGYKYVDNYFRYHDPLINSLDVPVWSFQTHSFQGPRSYFDCDVRRLVVSPSIPFEEVMGDARTLTTTGSYPLLLYGTFWYQLIPESNFRGAAHKPFSYIGSVIYLVALVPTAAFLFGALRIVRQLPAFVRRYADNRPEDCGTIVAVVSAALLAGNTALIVVAIMRYHVWALMQGRYLFPSMAGLFVVFASGVELFERTKGGAIVMKSSVIALMTLFGLYFFSEIGYLILHTFSPGIKALLLGASL
jgi:hypothetical protein